MMYLQHRALNCQLIETLFNLYIFAPNSFFLRNSAEVPFLTSKINNSANLLHHDFLRGIFLVKYLSCEVRYPTA